MTRTLVLGSGVSGVAAARLARRLGHSVTVYDQRPDSLLELMMEGFGTIGGKWDPLNLDGVDLVVTSPGIPERERPIVETLESGVTLWSEIELAWRHLSPGVKVIAITGTNGKTTVTDLISRMLTTSGLNAPAVGNIGTPLADVADTSIDAAVIEVSSFQLHYSERFRPDVAVVTNVAPDHLDWHGSFDRYLEAKARIVANQQDGDLLVYAGDDPGAVRLADRAPARRVSVTRDGVSGDGYGIDRDTGRLVCGSIVFDLAELRVADDAFLLDIALASAAAVAGGAAPGAVEDVARSFEPGAHRRQVIATIGGVTYVNDSKATNPHAALAAIRSYPSVILIAGGQAKGLDIGPLAAEPNVKSVVAIGESADVLLANAGPRGSKASSMEEAVRMATEAAAPGDVVLLAPACASFDMFDDYKHRGEVFSAIVTREGGAL